MWLWARWLVLLHQWPGWFTWLAVGKSIRSFARPASWSLNRLGHRYALLLFFNDMWQWLISIFYPSACFDAMPQSSFFLRVQQLYCHLSVLEQSLIWLIWKFIKNAKINCILETGTCDPCSVLCDYNQRIIMNGSPIVGFSKGLVKLKNSKVPHISNGKWMNGSQLACPQCPCIHQQQVGYPLDPWSFSLSESLQSIMAGIS